MRLPEGASLYWLCAWVAVAMVVAILMVIAFTRDHVRAGKPVPSSPGVFLIISGLGGAAYYVAFFKTYVSTAAGPVQNLGLLNDKTNGLLLSVASLIVGVVLCTRKRGPS